MVREHFDLRANNAFVETMAHYLALTVDSSCGDLAKVNPPVRDAQEQERLWGGVFDGTVQTVGTDHCAILKDMKKLDTGDILQAKLGFSGMATLFPAMVTHGVKKRGMSLQRLVELTSTNSAKTFGLYPKKGTISVGSDADLMTVDLGQPRTASARWIKGVSDFNVFEGETLYGFPGRTMVRGKVVYEDGEVVAEPGYGEYLARRS
jgi:dihydropyrimidinase